MQMVSASFTRYPIRKMTCRRKYPLPAPLPTGVWIFFLQGIRQCYTTQVPFQILIVLPLHGLKMSEKRLLNSPRKHGMPVFVSFARSNKYLVLRKIDILDSQATAFHQAQSSSVKQTRLEPVLVPQLCEQALDFGSRKHQWNARRPLGPFDVLEPG